ncbi:hypothetical protein RUM44_004450 [Polyplax serrata]|uniref:Uncharacterized protein n=1 Tax=Polyplax serrata TaxID=468196 RepID=A0ABR1B4L4_POLSC
MDDEIQETVESILGKGVKVVDCEKKSSIREEEVLLINGCPIPLEGEDGVAIREALIHGNVPNCDLLNQILIRAGILKAPVRLETSLSVKSSVVTREEVTVAKGGQIVDERTRETKEDNFYTSNTSEVWEPVGYEALPHNKRGGIKIIEGYPNSGSNSTFRSSSSSSSANQTQPSTSTDSAFFPSDTHQHSSSTNRHQSSSRGPNRTNSSTSADSANSTNSFARDSDFLPPHVNASSSPFIPNCSRKPYIPGLNNSNSTVTTTRTVIDPYGNERKSTTVEKTRNECNNVESLRNQNGNGGSVNQVVNGISKMRLDGYQGPVQNVRAFSSNLS